MSKIVILCGTNNIFNDSPYDIVDGITKIASTFEKIYPNSSIYISGLLPRDESWSVNRVTIDEIKSLQYQCIREGFIYIDQSIGWTYKNGELDPVLFYKDSLHLVEKGNVIFPSLPAATFPYKNVTKFKSHYESYNHSYSCSVSNGKLSCPVSVSNPVCTLSVKPSRIVSINKSICTVSISKSIRPVNVSKSTTPVNVSKSTRPVYVSKTICPVIVCSSPISVSKSSNPVNVPTRPRPVNISKPFCPVKISTCPARVSNCSRPFSVLTRPVNPIRSTYTKRKNFVNLLHLSAFLWEFLLLMCIIMNNVDTNHTSHNIPLTGNYSQQFNLNLNVKFCCYRDVLYYRLRNGLMVKVIALRNQQYKKFKKTLLHVDKEIFKETKYKVIKMIKSKKKLYFERKLHENIAKPKELWKAIKSLGLPCKSSAVSNICLKDKNGSLNFEDSSNANTFKKIFENLANDLVLKLPKAPNLYTLGKTLLYYNSLGLSRNSFKFSQISEEDMRKYLINLSPNKASGIDNLSGKFLKDGADGLALPISQLYNLSISLSTFPQHCKIAKLKPQYKKGSRTEPKNFRPISLLPLLSKLIEKTIHDQVQNYYNENNIFFSFQSGFRGKHSTDTCLTYLHDKILKGFDEGLLTGMITIDLQKAFDTIDHEILLSKMPLLGFSNNTIEWFRSYLSNRTFFFTLMICLKQSKLTSSFMLMIQA